jgi:hypothetical protein
MLSAAVVAVALSDRWLELAPAAYMPDQRSDLAADLSPAGSPWTPALGPAHVCAVLICSTQSAASSFLSTAVGLRSSS